MIIQYSSDLHLEFPANAAYLKNNPIEPTGDILLLAGDITLFSLLEKSSSFVTYLSDHFEQTFWIPGNHEHYHSDIGLRGSYFQESLRPNVQLLNNSAVTYKGVRFIFTTLWSKIELLNLGVISRGMADFHYIKYGNSLLDTVLYDQLHEESIAFLQKQLNTDATEPTIVVSHHLPTFINYPERYRYSRLNSAFATELAPMIKRSNIDFWIFGHSHESVPDFTVGRTVLTTNQLGYVERNEHGRFNPAKTIDVSTNTHVAMMY